MENIPIPKEELQVFMPQTPYPKTVAVRIRITR